MNKNTAFTKPKGRNYVTKDPNPKTVLDEIWFYNQQSGLDLSEDSYLNKDDDLRNPDSRYCNDFEEFCMLGEGGFGQVFKAKYNLDGNLYAIKKIALDFRRKDYCDKLLKEVTLLSRMHHKNIVRYYQAWIEDEKAENQFTEGSKRDSENASQALVTFDREKSESEDYKTFNQENKTPSLEKIIETKNQKSSQESFSKSQINEELFKSYNNPDLDIVFERDSKENENESSKHKSSDDSSDEEEEDSENSLEEEEDLIEEETKAGRIKTKSKTPKSSKKVVQKQWQPNKLDKNFKKILFIQMEFCEGLTLQHCLNSEKVLTWKEKMDLISQILDALIYIHEQNMIHRDLKPSNIFLDKDFKVKLGDFGLATKKEKKEFIVEETKSISKDSVKDHFQTLSKGIGTPLYASPEQQIAGKYNEKIDLFSFGLIVFEIFYKMRSDMQRYKVLMELRDKGTFPKDFDKEGDGDYSQIKNIINKLISHDPKTRPSAVEVFDMLVEFSSQEILKAYPNSFIRNKLIPHLFISRNCRNEDLIKPCPITPARKHIFDMIDAFFCKNDIDRIDIYDEVPLCDDLFFYDYTNLTNNNQILLLKKMNFSVFDLRKKKIMLLNPQGALFEMPDNLLQPWVCFISDKFTSLQKRYTIDKVLVQNPKKAKNSEEYMCAFDLIYFSEEVLEEDDNLYEAESLRMVYELMKEIIKEKKFKISVCHFGFLSFLLSEINFPVHSMGNIGKLLNFYSENNENLTETQLNIFLRDKLDLNLPNLASQLFKFFKLSVGSNNLTKSKGNQKEKLLIYKNTILLTLQSKIEGILGNEIKNIMLFQLLLQKLDVVLELCSLFQIPAELFELDMNLLVINNNLNYGGGLIFAIDKNIFKDHKNYKKMKHPKLLIGGRYDNLIQSYRKFQGENKCNIHCFGVGFQLFIDDLGKLINENAIPKKEEKEFCIISEANENLLKEKFDLAQKMKEYGFKVEFMKGKYNINKLDYLKNFDKIFVLLTKHAQKSQEVIYYEEIMSTEEKKTMKKERFNDQKKFLDFLMEKYEKFLRK